MFHSLASQRGLNMLRTWTRTTLFQSHIGRSRQKRYMLSRSKKQRTESSQILQDKQSYKSSGSRWSIPERFSSRRIRHFLGYLHAEVYFRKV